MPFGINKDQFSKMLQQSGQGAVSLTEALNRERAQKEMQQVSGEQDIAKQKEQEAAKVRAYEQVKQDAQSNPNYDYQVEGASVKKNRPEINPMALLALQTRQQDQMDRKVHQYGEDYRKTNIPASASTLEDVNKAMPGGIAGSGDLKSIGGAKNLVPGFLVGGLEKLGILPQGASAERASLQNLANTQIYDQSGKAINEAEMARLKDAMGWSPFTSPDVARDAIRRYGNTVLEKGRTIEAGTNPMAKEIAQSRGIPSVSRLANIIGSGGQQPASPIDAKKARLEELRRKAGK